MISSPALSISPQELIPPPEFQDTGYKGALNSLRDTRKKTAKLWERLQSQIAAIPLEKMEKILARLPENQKVFFQKLRDGNDVLAVPLNANLDSTKWALLRKDMTKLGAETASDVKKTFQKISEDVEKLPNVAKESLTKVPKGIWESYKNASLPVKISVALALVVAALDF